MNRNSRPRFFVLSLVAVLIASMLLTACGAGGAASGKPTITVGSKDFTEQFILGEMYAQVLENAGFPVERKLNLGGTPVAHEALLNGEIDLYPEYTGTALLTVLKQPVNSDPEAVYNTVWQMYADEFNLTWLKPAPMNNTQALAMTQARAEELGIVTISDMAAQAGELVLVGAPEFFEREDGLPGIKRVYGDFDLKDTLAVDSGLRYQALTSGQADVTVAYGTDGEIAAFELVLLEDDLGMFPPYNVAPVLRSAILADHPEIADLLDAVSAKLTNAAMQRLNYEVSGEGREPADVAREFLLAEGLLTEPAE